MRICRCFATTLVSASLVLAFAASANAQQAPGTAPTFDGGSPYSLKLSSTGSQEEGSGGGQPAEEVAVTDAWAEEGDYREVSSFFNVREANANVGRGECEFELTGEWVTGHGDGDDDFTLSPSVKYGITDDMYTELEFLPINIGDGGDQGPGDIGLTLFNQFVHEDGAMPALAAWAEMRIPSGDGSSGVDGSLHTAVTKTLATKLRGHIAGFVETANGSRDGGEDTRRPFQWGLGAGVDYECDPDTIGVLNYFHRSSENEGNPNYHLLEVGIVRKVYQDNYVKLAFDVGLDGHKETPDFGAKIQWAIDF